MSPPPKMLWQRRDELPPGLRTLRTGQLHFLDLVERYRISASLGSEPVGVGFDVATTEGGTSNPSSVTVSQQAGPGADARIILAWKTKDPAVAEGRITAILESIARRQAGGRPRKLCIDGSNERYFAETLDQGIITVSFRGVTLADRDLYEEG